MATSKLKTAVLAACVTAGLAGAGVATAWACGGYGVLRPVAPASAAKPFPLSSVEAPETKPDGPAPAWTRPAAGEALAAGTDKPGAADVGAAKPLQVVMTNPARDITIVSDRDEPFTTFFRRQPVLIATVPANVRDKLLYDAKGPVGMVFVDNASFNVNGPRASAYGASVKLAPLTFGGPAQRILEMAPEAHPIVFVLDAVDKDLWHAVGFTKRSPVGFFTGAERVKPDDFAPADLLHEPKGKK